MLLLRKLRELGGCVVRIVRYLYKDTRVPDASFRRWPTVLWVLRTARVVRSIWEALGGKLDEAEPPTGGNQTVTTSDREQELAVQLQAERQLRLNTEQEFTDYVGNSSTDSAASQSAVESSQQSTLDKIREQREARNKAIRERD